MKAKLDKLEEIEKSKGWSEVRFALALGIDYSYYYRVKRELRGIGTKFLEGLIRFCDEENLNFREFVDLADTCTNKRKREIQA